MDYLRRHCPVVYNSLLMEGKLNDHLAAIDRDATVRMVILIQQMKESQGIAELLNASDQLAWAAAMNNIRACTEEIVLLEMIYA